MSDRVILHLPSYVAHMDIHFSHMDDGCAMFGGRSLSPRVEGRISELPAEAREKIFALVDEAFKSAATYLNRFRLPGGVRAEVRIFQRESGAESGFGNDDPSYTCASVYVDGGSVELTDGEFSIPREDLLAIRAEIMNANDKILDIFGKIEREVEAYIEKNHPNSVYRIRAT